MSGDSNSASGSSTGEHRLIANFWFPPDWNSAQTRSGSPTLNQDSVIPVDQAKHTEDSAEKSSPITGAQIFLLITLLIILAGFFIYQILPPSDAIQIAAFTIIGGAIFIGLFAFVKMALNNKDSLLEGVSIFTLLLLAATGVTYFLVLTLHQNTIWFNIFQYAAPALLMVTLAVELFPFVARGNWREHKWTLLALGLGMILAAFALFPGANISEMIHIPLFIPAVAAGALIFGACLYDYAADLLSKIFTRTPASEHYNDASPRSPVHQRPSSQRNSFDGYDPQSPVSGRSHRGGSYDASSQSTFMQPSLLFSGPYPSAGTASFRRDVASPSPEPSSATIGSPDSSGGDKDSAGSRNLPSSHSLLAHPSATTSLPTDHHDASPDLEIAWSVDESKDGSILASAPDAKDDKDVFSQASSASNDSSTTSAPTVLPPLQIPVTDASSLSQTNPDVTGEDMHRLFG